MTSERLASFFAELATASGAAILPYFRVNAKADNKEAAGAFDPVTEGDRAGEQAIRALVEAAFPDHAIRGEEYGRVRAGADHEWIIDPIDGTRAFMCGLPTWGTLVGLMGPQGPIYGMLNQPFVGECFVGDGKTAKRLGSNGETDLKARRCSVLSEATIATTSPKIIRADVADAYATLEQKCRLVRYGTDCYAYAMVAAGQIDLVVETDLKAYDIMPLIPIIEGAGGVVTTWAGEPAHDGGDIVAAGSRTLHDVALRMLAGR